MLVDNKYVLGARSSVGDVRRRWEDRVYAGQIDRQNGEKLIVGIVADGVGSADFGARGAQLAIDKVIEYLTLGAAQGIPQLIKEAIKYANNAVFLENQAKQGDGLTTLVVAIIFQDRLFVGNVGDSRAYWVQTGTGANKNWKMLQLTRDHTYYNIHGGNPNDEHAQFLVNSIGSSPTIQIDLGFYLKGTDVDKAYDMGLTGLPLKPGDTVLLCSDGLIKSDLRGNRYATDSEIVDAIATEYEPDKAVIKMISQAEGRKPDDNVSAVTIQYLTPDLIKETIKRSTDRKRNTILRYGLLSLAGVMAILVIIIMGVNLGQARQLNQALGNLTITPIVITNTPEPTVVFISSGQAVVDRIWGQDVNVVETHLLSTGEEVRTGTNGRVWIRVKENNGLDGHLFVFKDTQVKVVFGDQIAPVLTRGAIYIQPATSIGKVDLSSVVGGLTATVSGSRMIVEVLDDSIVIYCFEGKCLLEPQDGDPIKIPTGKKIVFHIGTLTADQAEEMSYNDQWAWNVKCKYHCMSDLLPSPTATTEGDLFNPTATTVESTKWKPSKTPTFQPTKKPWPTRTKQPTKTKAPTKTPTKPPGPWHPHSLLNDQSLLDSEIVSEKIKEWFDWLSFRLFEPDRL